MDADKVQRTEYVSSISIYSKDAAEKDLKIKKVVKALQEIVNVKSYLCELIHELDFRPSKRKVLLDDLNGPNHISNTLRNIFYELVSINGESTKIGMVIRAMEEIQWKEAIDNILNIEWDEGLPTGKQSRKKKDAKSAKTKSLGMILRRAIFCTSKS